MTEWEQMLINGMSEQQVAEIYGEKVSTLRRCLYQSMFEEQFDNINVSSILK
jgi:hypothetical protein